MMGEGISYAKESKTSPRRIANRELTGRTGWRERKSAHDRYWDSRLARRRASVKRTTPSLRTRTKTKATGFWNRINPLRRYRERRGPRAEQGVVIDTGSLGRG